MSSVSRICPHCNEPYPVEATVCPHCGRPAEAAVSPPAHRQVSALIARAAVPVALGIVGIAARAGLALARRALARALSPAPADLPAERPGHPHVTVRVWQRREVGDDSGRRAWEEIHARWEIGEES
jgi:hypothetical protein